MVVSITEDIVDLVEVGHGVCKNRYNYFIITIIW